MFLSFIQWHNCPHASGVLTHTGGLHSMWQPLISCVPASPPKYGRPSGTFGVAMTAGDVGAHATPQDSHLTFPPRWWRVGTGPWVRPSLRSVEWVYGSIIGCAPPLNIFPWHPPALSLNINWQTSYRLLQANCWHVKTPRNASQDPETPPTHPLWLCQVLGQSWSVYSVRRSIWSE